MGRVVCILSPPQIQEMEAVVRQSQTYAQTLQNYNTSLQADVQQEKSRRDELCREKDKLQGQVAELGGMVKSQARLLELEKVRACGHTGVRAHRHAHTGTHARRHAQRAWSPVGGGGLCGCAVGTHTHTYICLTATCPSVSLPGLGACAACLCLYGRVTGCACACIAPGRACACIAPGRLLCGDGANPNV